MRGGASTAAARGLLALGLGFVLFARPYMHGVPPRATALFWGFVLWHVAIPGVAVCWALRLPRRDVLYLVGQGCSLGLLVQAIGHYGARALRTPVVADLTPLVVMGAALALRRSSRGRPDGTAPEPGRPPVELLLALILLACALQPIFSERHLGAPIPVDLLFHAGNAGEARHRWPLENPRIAGLPLRYPMLAYALPAGAAGPCGMPVADVLLALCPLLWLPLVVIQLYNAGRVLFEDAHAAALGAAIVVLHADPGYLLGLGRWAFNSHLATGLYGSPTTVCGFILMASLAVCISEWLSSSGGDRRLLALVALMSLASSAAKASVLPVVGGGLAAVTLWAWRRQRDLARAAALALAMAALAGAPLTLWLAGGEGGYQGMLRFGLAAAMRQSAFAHWLARLTGAGSPPTPWLGAAAFLPWLLGYLGLAGVGFLVWVRARHAPLRPREIWAFGAIGTGAVLGLCLEAFGLSQLFFLYNGQLLLALFAGAGIMLALRERRRTSLALLLGSALPSLLLMATGPLGANREDRQARARDWTAAEARYAEALAWLRANAADNSVILADNPSLYLSGFGECRLFYESGLYSPAGDASGDPSPDLAYAERVGLQDRLLRRPSKEAMEAVVGRFPAGTDVRIVADSVQMGIEAGVEIAAVGRVPPRRLFPRDVLDLEFSNAAVHVYRVVPALKRSPDLPSGRAAP